MFDFGKRRQNVSDRGVVEWGGGGVPVPVADFADLALELESRGILADLWVRLQERYGVFKRR